MAKVLLGTLVATSGNNDIHVNIFQVTAYYSTHVFTEVPMLFMFNINT